MHLRSFVVVWWYLSAPKTCPAKELANSGAISDLWWTDYDWLSNIMNCHSCHGRSCQGIWFLQCSWNVSTLHSQSFTALPLRSCTFCRRMSSSMCRTWQFLPGGQGCPECGLKPEAPRTNICPLHLRSLGSGGRNTEEIDGNCLGRRTKPGSITILINSYQLRV